MGSLPEWQAFFQNPAKADVVFPSVQPLNFRCVDGGNFACKRLGPRRAVHQLAAAIGAAVVQVPRRNSAQKVAFERTDERTGGGIGWQACTAVFAIGAHFEGHGAWPFLNRRSHGFANGIHDLFDLALIIALGHHPDYRLGARTGGSQGVPCRQARPRPSGESLPLRCHDRAAAAFIAHVLQKLRHRLEHVQQLARLLARPHEARQHPQCGDCAIAGEGGRDRSRIMWPDCSPPTLYPPAFIASST